MQAENRPCLAVTNDDMKKLLSLPPNLVDNFHDVTRLGHDEYFGTTREMISSTLAIQNIVNDLREIRHHGHKPHPSIFVQNAKVDTAITSNNTNLWIENSHIGRRWKLSHDNVVTGVPENDWDITLSEGQCIDIVPVGDDKHVLRRRKANARFVDMSLSNAGLQVSRS